MRFFSAIGPHYRLHIIPKRTKIDPMISVDCESWLTSVDVESLSNGRIHSESKEGVQYRNAQFAIMCSAGRVTVRLGICEEHLRRLQVLSCEAHNRSTVRGPVACGSHHK